MMMQIWDTAGQERFRTIVNSYYRGAHGVIVVYDITSRISFESLDYWMEQIKQNATENVPILIIGNKCDLEEFRQVDKTEKTILAINKSLLY